MSEFHGKFCWCELITSDAAAAAAFYRAVIGWESRSADVPGIAYTLLSANGSDVAGIFASPECVAGEGKRPGWIGFIAADDVDATAARITAAGGGVHRAPEDIPNVGRFAIVNDPQGAVFTLFRPAGGEQKPPAPPMAPGHVGWHELRAADVEGAFAFYAGLFGWTKGEAMDMGPMGVYQLFATGGMPVGGMMAKTPEMPHPHWLYYFNVDDTEAALGRAKAAGGEVMHGPTQVPGGSWIAQCRDPQGGIFAIVGPDRAAAPPGAN